MQREIRPFRPEDAATVAEMWNASDSVWPGGFTRGVPFTAERILHWLERERDLEVYVAFADGKAVGFLSLTEFWESSKVAYVQLLGAHPAYHGQGFGRDLLRVALRKTLDLGYERLDLHTWAGNLKAVPLYKKTGFFWLPGTSVHMHNYLPTVLRLEAARRFFRVGEPDEVDWYSAFRRDLSVRPDEWEERGMRVFPYEFAAEGRRLRVLVDPEARGVTSVETERFQIAAWRTARLAPRGMASRVELEVRNVAPESGPLAAALLVHGDDGIRADLLRTLSVDRVESVEVKAVPSDTAEVPLGHDPAAAIRTTAVLGDDVVELATGLRVAVPVEVSAPGGCVVLRPGVPTPVALLLRSSLPAPARVGVQLAGTPGLEVAPGRHEVEIPAEGTAGVRVTLTARESGAYPLGAVLGVEGADLVSQPGPQSVPVHAVAPGESAWSAGERQAYLASPELVVIANRRGGGIDVVDPRTGTRVGGCYSNLGPPFGPTTLDSADYDVRLEENGPRKTVVLSAQPSFLPGVVFERRAELVPGGALRLYHRLANGGSETLSPAVVTAFQMGHDAARFAAPLKTGLVVDEALALPDWEDVPFQDPRIFAEPWMAIETDGLAIGFVWDRPTDLGFPWEAHHFDATHSFGEVAPGQSADTHDLWLVVGPGDWRAIRRFWRASLAPAAPTLGPIPRPALDLRLETPMLSDGALRATLSSARARRLTGSLTVDAPEGVTVEPREVAVEGLTAGSPISVDLRVDLPGKGYAAVEGTARASLGWIEKHFPIALVRAGDPKKSVGVAESKRDGQTVVTIDNGLLRLAVGPEHGGSLFELVDGGASHLLTSFPTPEPHLELNPWFGGVTPQVWLSPGYHQPRPMAARSYRWAEASRELLGQTWRGVRLSAELDREHDRGMGVEVDYLTVGGSNLVALAVRIDTHGAPLRGLPGFLCFPAPDGNTKGTIGHFRRAGLHSRRQVGGLEARVEGWCAFESKTTGRCLAAFAPDPGTSLELDHDEDYIRFYVRGRPDSALDAELRNEPVEAVLYLAVARSVEEARVYRLLGSERA